MNMEKRLHKKTGLWVCPNGDVYGKRGLRKAYVNPYGYVEYSYFTSEGKKKNIKGHILVAECYIGERNGLQVRHMNHDRTDNRVENLKLGTAAENKEDSMRDDRLHKHPQPLRRKIAEMYKTGRYSQSQLARMFGVTQPSVLNYIREFADE